MKIAVPTAQGRFSEHFGGAECFGLYDVDEAAKTIRSKVEAEAPPHERGAYPRWLREQGAEVILAGGMGPRAIQMFDHYGIKVVVGVSGDAPDALVQSFLEGTLISSGDPCTGGHLHDCGDHGHED